MYVSEGYLYPTGSCLAQPMALMLHYTLGFDTHLLPSLLAPKPLVVLVGGDGGLDGLPLLAAAPAQKTVRTCELIHAQLFGDADERHIFNI